MHLVPSRFWLATEPWCAFTSARRLAFALAILPGYRTFLEVFNIGIQLGLILGISCKWLEGRQNWSVSRATAQVGSELVFDFLHCEASLFVQSVHVHDPTGGAESALSSVVVCKDLLERMVTFFVVSDAFNCLYRPPLALKYWNQTLKCDLISHSGWSKMRRCYTILTEFTANRTFFCVSGWVVDTATMQQPQPPSKHMYFVPCKSSCLRR